MKAERIDNDHNTNGAQNLPDGEHGEVVLGQESIKGEEPSAFSSTKDGDKTPAESDTDDEDFTSKTKLCGRYRSVSE